SSLLPVWMLTTPPGTSDVARTSANVIAGMGADSAARTTVVLPGTRTGITAPANPHRAGSSGATTPTTPVGPGVAMVTKGPATVPRFPRTWANLSDQPAYHTIRSTVSATSRVAWALVAPRSINCSTNVPVRSARVSAIR